MKKITQVFTVALFIGIALLTTSPASASDWSSPTHRHDLSVECGQSGDSIEFIGWNGESDITYKESADGFKVANIYLTDDVTLDYPIYVDYDHELNICLNGHTLTTQNEAAVITLGGRNPTNDRKCSLSICDCGNTGKIDSQDAQLAIRMGQTNASGQTDRISFTMYGGTIEGSGLYCINTSSDYDTITIDGGTIVSYGDACIRSSGNLIINGGVFDGTVDNLISSSGNLELNGGTFKGTPSTDSVHQSAAIAVVGNTLLNHSSTAIINKMPVFNGDLDYDFVSTGGFFEPYQSLILNTNLADNQEKIKIASKTYNSSQDQQSAFLENWSIFMKDKDPNDYIASFDYKTGSEMNAALNEDGDPYLDLNQVYVNGQAFTEDKNVIDCGNGTATLEEKNGEYTLTLDNVEITKPSVTGSGIFSNSPLNIVLKGHNVIGKPTTDEFYNENFNTGLYSRDSDMIISGEPGSGLEINPPDNNSVLIEAMNLTFNNVRFTTNKSDIYLAINTVKKFTCNDSLIDLRDILVKSLNIPAAAICSFNSEFNNSEVYVQIKGAYAFLGTPTFNATTGTLSSDEGVFWFGSLPNYNYQSVTASTEENGNNPVPYDPQEGASYKWVNLDVNKVADPILPQSTSFTDVYEVEITCPTEGAQIYFTTDGSEPTTESNLYTGPISFSNTTEIKAIAVKEDYLNSGISRGMYTKVSYNYYISISDLENGRIVIVNGKNTAEANEKVTIDVIPDSGYHLDELSIVANNKEISFYENDDGTYSFTMPYYPVKISATFTRDFIVIPDPDPDNPSEEPEDPDHESDLLSFSDVNESDWYYDVVKYVYENGLMTGVSENEFAPNLTTSRGMIVSILYRSEGNPTVSDPHFNDVENDAWYSKPVAWAASTGIVSGYGDGTFGPNDSITREQMASILYRYAEYKGIDVSARGALDKYSDANKISSWAMDVMSWANAEGLITGTSEDKLDPQGTATRAQVAAMMQRFFENILK